MDISGFKIQRAIGKGGMGTVYLAIQESLERSVVLKTVGIANVESSEVLERFLNEGRIVASLRHPNIVTIFDIGTADDVLYISMEYVEGGDLRDKLQEGLSCIESLDIIAKVASALDLAHSRGIVHRDVKPANILFREDGTPLLSDFGIAKQTEIDTELTSTGTILGSPFYMSPEQADGLRVDGRTDIYSLGVILYEMLVGERPYQGESAVTVILQHVQAPIPELPSDLERFQPLLNGMMAKERGTRIQNAATLVNEVKKLQRAEQAAERVAVGATTTTQVPAARGNAAGVGHSSPAAPATWNTPTVRILLGIVVLQALSFAGFYLYTQSLEKPGLVKPAAQFSEAAGAPPPRGELNNVGGAPPPEEAPAAGTDVADRGPNREDVMKALRWLGKHSLEADRLTEPAGDNAYYYYGRLLSLDPDSVEAMAGFARIADRYAALAEQAFARQDYEHAAGYVARGLQVQGDNERLLKIRGRVEERQSTIFKNVLQGGKRES